MRARTGRPAARHRQCSVRPRYGDASSASPARRGGADLRVHTIRYRDILTLAA